MAASTASPRQRTVPASASSTPRTMRIAVVLPAPFGPTKPNIWPGATEKETPSSAVRSPKRRESPDSSSTTSVVPPGSSGFRGVVRTADAPRCASSKRPMTPTSGPLDRSPYCRASGGAPGTILLVSRAPLAGAERGSADLGRLVLALEALAPALDGRDELGEVDLERVEDLVRVVLGAEADLALAGAGVLDDVLGGALGLLRDLLVRDELGLAVAGLLDDALGLALRLGEHLLALLDDPARLLDLLGDRGAHLVEDVVDLLLVHTHLVRQRDLLRVVDEIVQLVDQYEDVH